MDSASDSLRAVFTGRWSIEPPLVLALGLMTIVYLCGWLHLRARRPGRVSVWHLGAFVAGLSTLFVALASPFDTFADRRLVFHMAQHLLLLVVAPALIVLGSPTVPVLLGLPAGRVRAVVGALLTRIVDRFSNPLLGLTAMSLAMWGWHWPSAFELAVRSPGWHVVEHSSFLGAGLLFWWPVVEPWPSRRRWPRWAMIPYLLLADVQNTALAALLVFSDRVLYPTYAGGGSPLDDQAAAGVLMWVPMSLAYLIPAGVLTAQILSPSTGSSRSQSSSSWRMASSVGLIVLGSALRLYGDRSELVTSTGGNPQRAMTRAKYLSTLRSSHHVHWPNVLI